MVAIPCRFKSCHLHQKIKGEQSLSFDFFVQASRLEARKAKLCQGLHLEEKKIAVNDAASQGSKSCHLHQTVEIRTKWFGFLLFLSCFFILKDKELLNDKVSDKEKYLNRNISNYIMDAEDFIE